MGAKRKVAAKSRQHTNNNYDNVINIKPMGHSVQKKTQVNILPRNRNQETYVLTLLDPKKDIVFGVGPAGTGKTLLAVQVAVKLFKEGQVDKIIVTRPAVSVDEDLGFLPGTLEEKMAPWTRPIFDVLREYFHAKEIEGMIQEGVIEIAPLAYMRGRTLDNAFIILDESQNANDLQIKMFLTRMGANAKAIITGDPTQVDLPRNQKSGLEKAVRILQNIEGIAHIQLDEEDVVRHKLVKAIIKAYDKERENETENTYHR